MKLGTTLSLSFGGVSTLLVAIAYSVGGTGATGIAVCAGALALGWAAAWKLGAGLAPISQILASVEAAAAGDLTRPPEIQAGGEIGRLAGSVSTLLEGMRRNLRDIGNEGTAMSQAAATLSAAATSMGDGVQRITDQSTIVAGTTTQLTDNISAVTDSVQEASRNVGTVAASVEEMSVNLADVSNSVKGMSSDVDSVASAIEEMTASRGSGGQRRQGG